MVFPTYEFRPIKAGQYFRYANGLWLECDETEYDLAFVGISEKWMVWAVTIPYRTNILWSWAKNGQWAVSVPEHPNGNAWHYMLKEGTIGWGESWDRYSHPNTIASDKAMNKCCDMYGCANGRGPEFHINDPYIAQGLVRNAETKEILRFPKIFKCMYCGNIDWRKAEEQ